MRYFYKSLRNYNGLIVSATFVETQVKLKIALIVIGFKWLTGCCHLTSETTADY